MLDTFIKSIAIRTRTCIEIMSIMKWSQLNEIFENVNESFPGGQNTVKEWVILLNDNQTTILGFLSFLVYFPFDPRDMDIDQRFSS